MRTELDDDDSAVLVLQIREEIKKEVAAIKRDEGVDLERIWSRRAQGGKGSGGRTMSPSKM